MMHPYLSACVKDISIILIFSSYLTCTNSIQALHVPTINLFEDHEAIL